MDFRSYRGRRLPAAAGMIVAAGLAASWALPVSLLHAAPPAKSAGLTQLFGDKLMFVAKSRNSVEHVTDRNFQEKVLESDVPVLVDFYADWCGPCKALAPVLEEVARETPDAKIVKVNVDHSPELANQFAVEAVPCLLVFRNGDLVHRHAGLLSKGNVKNLLSR
jgi:thioredoxin 1